MRLELCDVHAGYGSVDVLRDVSVVVPSGSIVAVVGPNGAGKTTTLNVASGLLGSRSGRVLMDDHDRTHMSADARARLGLCHVPETASVFPGLTVTENIRMFVPGRSFHEALDMAMEAFPRLGQRAGQLAGNLSGGEQRMLALARAYVRSPRLILADELSMGLAPIIVDEIFEFLRERAAAGTSLLLVEQYVAKALELADFVYLLARGRIVFAGEPGELADSDLADRYLSAG